MEDYGSEDDDATVEQYRQCRTQKFVDLDEVSLVETPREARIKNALENPHTATDDRVSTVPRSNFFSRGVERSYGSAQPQKLGRFHYNNTMVDTIIHQSINLDLESKQEKRLAKAKEKKIEVGPMKGEAAETTLETINPYKILEKQYQQEQLFKKQRPKSAYHDKFARLGKRKGSERRPTLIN